MRRLFCFVLSSRRIIYMYMCSYNVLKLCRCNEMAFTLAALLKRLAIVELEIHAFCENQHEIMIFLLVAVVVFSLLC